MANPTRGSIVKLTVVVAYPDGSTKTAEIDPQGLDAIYFSETAMDEEAKGLFLPEADWRENPTFIERRGAELLRKCKINQCLQPY